MSGSGFKELKRVFVKDSVSPQSETDAIAAINKAKHTSKETVASEPTPNQSPQSEQKREEDTTLHSTIALTQDQLSVVVQNAIAQALKPGEEKITALQQQVDAASAKAEADKAAVVDELNRTKQERDKLADVFKLMGNPNPVQMPSININTRVNSDSPQGSVAELQQIRDRAAKIQKMTAGGSAYIAVDNSEIKRYVKTHKQQLIQDLESWGKAHGLLQGQRRISTDAATTAANIPGGFLEHLSAIMRENNRPGFIFWQFPVTRIEFDKGMGDTIKIPRAAYLPAITNPDDRLLSGNGTYSYIDNTSQNIQTGVVSVTLQEWGLGKNSNYPPVGIPAFVQAYSMIDLMQILERNLQHDYWTWEDTKIRSLWRSTSRVVYNKKGSVVTSAADVGAGDGGTLSENFLNSTYGYLRSLQIPTYRDGCYGLAVNTLSLVQLKNDLGAKYAPPTAATLQELTNILNPNVIGSGEVDKVTGYAGKWMNFHVFETNAFGCGAPGTEGVQLETIGGGSHITRSSYAFGADTIGRGIGSEMEIRRDNNDDFGRMNRWIWKAEEGFCQLDCCPDPADTSPVPQQLRVIEIRNTSEEV